MSKLSPDLAAYLHHLEQSGADAPVTGDDLISVQVTYEGDLELLRAAGLETGLDRNGVVSGMIPLSRVLDLEAVPNVSYIRKPPTAAPLLDKSIPEIKVPWKLAPATPGGRGEGVIVAIIDTGIDIEHESFRDGPNNTRILELWDQGATTGGAAPTAPYTPSRGRIYSRDQINAMLTQRSNERTAGTALTPFPTRDTNGHGTHVAGIAAGNGRQDDRCSGPGEYVGVAPEASLVVVKYIGATNGDFREALDWAAEAKTRHILHWPVVINLSLHTGLTGTHDDTDQEAKDINDILVNAPGGIPAGVAVVCAAGNQGDSNHHESGTVASGGTVTFQVGIHNVTEEYQKKLTAGQKTDSAIITFWYDSAATFNVTLTAPPNPALPGSNTVGPIAPAATSNNSTIGKMSVSIWSSQAAETGRGNRKRISITITANAKLALRPGPWTVTLTETSHNAGSFHAYMWRDFYSPTFARDTDTDADKARRRAFTVVTPGTARSAITVANYESTDTMNPSSSWGPFPIPTTTPVAEVKPTLSAPGTSIAAPFGEDSTEHERNSSCCDQKVVDLTGTSMASPHIAGVVALMFCKNASYTFEQARQALQVGCTIADLPAAEAPDVYPTGGGRPPNPLSIRANHMWGSGRIDASDALSRVPDAVGGGGGGGGGTITWDEPDWGYVPHSIFSRLAEVQRQLGSRPGFELAAALISAHVDETLHLINHNRRVGAVWQRHGGPALVRNMLHWRDPLGTMIPLEVQGFSIRKLFTRFLAILEQFASDRLRSDIERFGGFANVWPGLDWDELDRAALAMLPKR